MTVDELLQALREKLRDDGEHIIAGEFIRPAAFADLIRRDERTLRRWREREIGPPLRSIGRLTLYSLRDVAAFLMSANVRAREPAPLSARELRTHSHTRPAEPCCTRRRSA